MTPLPFLMAGKKKRKRNEDTANVKTIKAKTHKENLPGRKNKF